MHEKSTVEKISVLRVCKSILPFIVLAIAIAIVHMTGLDEVLNTEWIDTHISHHGWYGVAIYIGLVAFFTALAVPRQLMSFLGGYAFGAMFGTLWGTIGSSIGCIMAFYYARLAARESLQKRLGRHVLRLDRFFASNPLAMSIIIRCLPVGNNLLTSMTAGVTSVSAPKFFIGSFIGYIPQNVIFALLGSGISVSPILRTAVSAVLFVISGILGYYLFKKYRADIVVHDEIDNIKNSTI